MAIDRPIADDRIRLPSARVGSGTGPRVMMGTMTTTRPTFVDPDPVKSEQRFGRMYEGEAACTGTR